MRRRQRGPIQTRIQQLPTLTFQPNPHFPSNENDCILCSLHEDRGNCAQYKSGQDLFQGLWSFWEIALFGRFARNGPTRHKTTIIYILARLNQIGQFQGFWTLTISLKKRSDVVMKFITTSTSFVVLESKCNFDRCDSDYTIPVDARYG